MNIISIFMITLWDYKYHIFIFLKSSESHPPPSILLVQSQISSSFYLKLIIYTHLSETACWEVKLFIYLGVFWSDCPLLNKLFYYQYYFWIESSLQFYDCLNLLGIFFNFKGIFGLLISFNFISRKAIVLVGVNVFFLNLP